MFAYNLISEKCHLQTVRGSSDFWFSIWILWGAYDYEERSWPERWMLTEHNIVMSLWERLLLYQRSIFFIVYSLPVWSCLLQIFSDWFQLKTLSVYILLWHFSLLKIEIFTSACSNELLLVNHVGKRYCIPVFKYMFVLVTSGGWFSWNWKRILYDHNVLTILTTHIEFL